jgi:hypothetical protein
MNLLEKALPKLGKRGQVTIFIIAGAVILFAAFFVGYLQNDSFRQKVESGLFGSVVVPEQAKGVVSAINNCMEALIEEGLGLLGSNGGYIEIPSAILNNPRRVLEFDENTKIPYWVYGNKVDIPSTREMEKELTDYVNARIGECDLSQFNLEEGFLEESNLNVGITKKSVIVKLVSDIEVSIKGNVFDLSNYVFIEVESSLKKMYDVSRAIVNKELGSDLEAPLERFTLDLIAAYGLGNRESIPPIAGTDFECSPKIWIKPEVKKTIKDVLASSLIYLQVIGSDNFNVEPGFYESMTWNIGEDASGLDVNFLYYPEWPMFLDVFPSDGIVIKGNRVVNAFPILFFCMNFYNFRYDLDYPIVVDLVDEEGYRFRFPLEVVMRDNYGRRRVFDNDFYEGTQTLFCDLNQRLSKEILVTSQTDNGVSLDGSDVIYTCGGESCSIGKTDISGELRSKFPLCYGGRLDLVKNGYLSSRQKLDVDTTTDISVGGVLHKFETRKVKGKVFDIKEGRERELKPGEEILVQFNRFNTELNDYDHYLAFVLKEKGLEEINVVPGLYHVEMSLISKEEITIPEKTIKLGPLGAFGSEKLPEITFDTMVEGGAKYEWFLEDTNFENMELTVLSWGLPESYEDLNQNYDVEALSLEHGSRLNLVFE